MTVKARVFQIVTLAVFLLGVVRTSPAALFSSLDFEQGITYTTVVPYSSDITQVIDSTIPFSKTVALSTQNGGTLSSNYQIFDTGTTAGIMIGTSASATAINNFLTEETLSIGNGGGGDSVFEFSNSVTYSLSVTTTGQISNGELRLGPAASIIDLYQMDANTQYHFTGTLSAGVPYHLVESWQLANQVQGSGVSPPAVVSGSESIVFTFAAVPEPYSAALLATFALVPRRRRARRTAWPLWRRSGPCNTSPVS